MNLRSILEEIIVASGGRIYPGYPEEYIWIEHQDGSNEVIMLLFEDDLNLVKDFQSSTSNFPGERYIFALRDVSNDIYSFCISKKITCIKRDELINILGKSIIDLSLKVKRSTNEIKLDEPDSIYIRLETGTMPKFIKPPLSAPEIRESLGVKAELFFIPYHFYTYVCDLKMEDKVVKKNGGVMVNSVNSIPRDIVKGFELVDRWPFPHREMEPKWEPDEASESANKWIRENNIGITTEGKETKYFFVYFRKKTEPLEDSIKIKYEGTYFYPFFVSSGLALDGLTGEMYNIQDIF